MTILRASCVCCLGLYLLYYPPLLQSNIFVIPVLSQLCQWRLLDLCTGRRKGHRAETAHIPLDKIYQLIHLPALLIIERWKHRGGVFTLVSTELSIVFILYGNGGGGPGLPWFKSILKLSKKCSFN